MEKSVDENIDAVKKQYAEAFSYIGGNMLLMNPQKAFSIFEKLADDGFVAAVFYCGIMLCMGFGIEKNFEKGKALIKSQEKTLGYDTEIVIEKLGLFNELSLSEKLTCIKRWENNNQTTHALYLKTQC